MFEPWMFAAMEEEGYIDTPDGLINRVAKYLVQTSHGDIGTEEFCKACKACGVDLKFFTQSNLVKLEKRLNELRRSAI